MKAFCVNIVQNCQLRLICENSIICMKSLVSLWISSSDTGKNSQCQQNGNMPLNADVLMSNELTCRGGSSTSLSECSKLLFGQIFAENCMNMKENGLRGGGTSRAPPSLPDPPLEFFAVNLILSDLAVLCR